MDRIAITGIEVFAHHGVLEHEREVGQRFVVDVVLEADLSRAARSDGLEDTVDYGAVAGMVASVVAGPPARLLETVAGRVAERCLDDSRVTAVEVPLHKPNAPLPVVAREAAVTLRRARSSVQEPRRD